MTAVINRMGTDGIDVKKPHFITVTRLEDAQAIRTAEFHPSGQLYAIGSNSKTLRICAYPKIAELRLVCNFRYFKVFCNFLLLVK